MRARSLLSLAAALVGAVSGTACTARQLRRAGDWHGAGALAHDVAYRRPVPGGAPAALSAPADGIAHYAFRLRGAAGPRRAGLAVGIDLAAGASHPAGLAWRAAVSPVGLGRALGRHGVAGVIAGVGASGIAGRVDAGLELPVELFVAVRAGRRVGVSLFVQPAWFPGAASRRRGAPGVRFADELRAGVTVRLGRNARRWGLRAGNGYHVGVVASGEHGARWLGVTFGYDLDVATE